MSNVRFVLDSKALDDAKKNFRAFQAVVEGSSKEASKRHPVMQAAADAIAKLDKLVTGTEQVEEKAKEANNTPTSKTKTYAEAAKQADATKEAKKDEPVSAAKKLEDILAQSELTLAALELALENGSQADPAKFKKAPFALIAKPLYDFVLALKYNIMLKKQIDLVKTHALKSATEANAAEIQSLKSQLETAKAARSGIVGSSVLEVKGENPEVTDLQTKLHAALRDMDALKDENGILVNEKGSYKSRLEGMAEDHDKLQIMQDQMTALANRNKSLIEQLESANKAREAQDSVIIQNIQTIENAKAAAKTMKEQLDHAIAEKNKIATQHGAHEEKETPALVNAKVASAEAAANAANQKVKELEAQVATLKKSVPLDNVPVAREIAFQNESKEMHRRASVAETEASRVATENARLVKELADLRATMAKEIEAAKADHIMNLELDIARITKERDDARAALGHIPGALDDLAVNLAPLAGTPKQHGVAQSSSEMNDNVFHLPSSLSGASQAAPQNDFSVVDSSSSPLIGENNPVLGAANPAPQAVAAPSRGWMGWMLASVVAGGLATVSALSMAGILTLMASNPLTLTLAIVAGVSAMLSARQSYASYPASQVEGSSDIANANNVDGASSENPLHAEPAAEDSLGQSHANDPDNSFVLPEDSNGIDGTQQKITASLTDPNLEGVEVVVNADNAVANDNVVPLPLKRNSVSVSSDDAHSDESPHVHFEDLPSDSTKSTDDNLANNEGEVPTAPVTPISNAGSKNNSPKLNPVNPDLHVQPGTAALMSAMRTSPLNRAVQEKNAAEAAILLQNNQDAVATTLTPSQNAQG